MMFQADTLAAVQSQAATVVDEAAISGIMPQGGPPLTAAEKLRVRLWAWSGAQ